MRGSRSLLAGIPIVAWAVATLPAGARAQEGAGSTGAMVLQLLAGGRAAALSGAYTAASDDSDVLFYNVAGIGGVEAAASLSYQRHVEEIGLASASAAYRAGPVILGASAVFLDYGEIAELTPDPAFGGQTGLPTGNTLSAAEFSARLGAALPLLGDRLRIGAAAGLVSVQLAGIARTTPLFDAGAQYDVSGVTIGASLRNMGSALSGDDIADAELPSEARLGATFAIGGPERLGARLFTDLVAELNEGGAGLVAGVEAGLQPGGANRIGAVGRFGYNGTLGEEGLGALQIGAGLRFGDFALDYAYQNYDFFGSQHRFGVRWAKMP